MLFCWQFLKMGHFELKMFSIFCRGAMMKNGIKCISSSILPTYISGFLTLLISKRRVFHKKKLVPFRKNLWLKSCWWGLRVWIRKKYPILYQYSNFIQHFPAGKFFMVFHIPTENHDFKYSTKKANFEWCVESYFFSSDSDELSIQLLKILSLPWRGEIKS